MSSRGVNKVILVGNLGQDPEIKHLQNGNAVCNITVATSETWKDKQTGEQKEQTEWHRVVAFQRLAEIMGEYLHRGSKVYIEGSLKTRKWQDQSGQDRYTTEIVASEMQMLDSRSGVTSSSQGQQPQQGGHQQPQQQQMQQPMQQQGYQQQPQQVYQQQQGYQQQNQQQSQMAHGNNQQQSTPNGFDDDIPF